MTTPQRGQYVHEMAEYYLSLPLDELAMLMSDELHRGDVLTAARLTPGLMERVFDAFGLMRSPLSPEEEQESTPRRRTRGKGLSRKDIRSI